MRSRRAVAVLGLALGLLGTMLLVVGPTQTAGAATKKGLANGSIVCPKRSDCPKITMLVFDAKWNYLTRKKANGGGYSIWLEPGVYRLQFVDQRPAYDVTKYAPTDVKVRVRANDLSTRTVKMRKGAVITGTVRTGDRKPARAAEVRAAHRDGRSFSTTANKAGQFAIGGLPPGAYSLFGWDKQKRWVGKSTWAGRIKAGKSRNLAVRLNKRAGNLTIYLFTPGGRMTKKTPVTVTSKRTGQWWTATARQGTVVFRGLYPGRYRMKFDGAGVWFPQDGAVAKGRVRPGAMAFGSFRLTKRGGWLTGSLVDVAPEQTVALTPPWSGAKGATLSLYDASGARLSSTTSNTQGRFRLTGQLRTQSGLTLVIEPTADSGGYMRGIGYCLYSRIEYPGISVRAGRPTALGALRVPRAPDQGIACNPESVTPSPTPTESPTESPTGSSTGSPTPTDPPSPTDTPTETPTGTPTSNPTATAAG